ncbi:MAG: TadE/TadG family protein [Hyphomicrobiales bacterium]|nr:MAG: TadE/TadG family protein [Hyphomicrobiales bacterium]
MPGFLKAAVLRTTTLLRRAHADTRGSVSMMFVVLIIPLIACVGMAVDLGRAYRVQSIAQNAIDSATLAAGKAAQTNSSTPLTSATTAATNYFNTAKPTNVLSSTISFSANPTNTIFTVTGTTWVATPFLSILSRLSSGSAEAGAPSACTSKYSCLKIVNTATASIAAGGNGGSNVEVALMLDVTGSMTGSKIATLISAANDLVDTIIWTDQSQYTSRVAIAPFAPTVNVGSYFNAITGSSTTQSSQSCGWTGNWWSGWSWTCTTSNFSIGACVVDRTGTNAFTDVAPGTGNYLPSYYSATGDSSACTPSAIIQPLTSDKSALHTTINSLTAGGGTAGALGTAFAYYLLSPNWASVWGTASAPGSYSDLTTLNSNGAAKLQKYAVLMTDGDYNIMGGVGANQTTANNAALSLCTAMKNRGIVVYTVGFELQYSSAAATTMLTSCATSSSYFYDASSEAALVAAFRDIALKISSLRLTN